MSKTTFHKNYKERVKEIETKWQEVWEKDKDFSAEDFSLKPKCYVLDMFPYPSGAGLHVGHPLGYIASDIYSRYKRLCGFNVLHPIGIDAFGLPAEQYAIQTGIHPAASTKINIKQYIMQLKKIGFSFDWDRFIQTNNPDYYKWTQYLFLTFYNSWYDIQADKAKPIAHLIAIFEKQGNQSFLTANTSQERFNSSQWNSFSEGKQQEILLNYRLAYLKNSMVNWCPELGTVLANDEVKNGYSERGSYPVVQKKMQQWCLKISAFSERLLTGLNELDWSDSIKEIQRNWIGKSEGVEMYFDIENTDEKIQVFTTRPDTIFGVSFMVLAPEHDLVHKITTDEQKKTVAEYAIKVQKKSELERLSGVKQITGAFTGAYAIHPITKEKLPIWIADYVLISYGTGAVMAVPCGDQRDLDFAKFFSIAIKNIFQGVEINNVACEEKKGTYKNSDFLNGLDYNQARKKIINYIQQRQLGRITINYKLRDAVFSRQRYWGEPFPIYYKNGIPFALKEKDLPIKLPDVENYLPTKEGKPPLARLEKDWDTKEGYPLDVNVMPGWAGSSWYFLRYLDPKNATTFVAKEKADYWGQVDLYIGGAEHATGHLLYSRMFTKLLYDLHLIPFDEPFKKLINQGMMQGVSAYTFKLVNANTIISSTLTEGKEVIKIPVDINFVNSDNSLKVQEFKAWRSEYSQLDTIMDGDKIYCLRETEKMSKSKYNVIIPDELIERYGADTLRCYEMFLGPIEQHKPWNTKGIEGVFRFLNKFWNLFFEEGLFSLDESTPIDKELKVLHKTIKKIKEDIERFSFNTVVSNLMIATNQLVELGCKKRAILSDMVILISPYAPHIAEELWQMMGNKEKISYQCFPKYQDRYIVSETTNYPISFNGKMKFLVELSASLSKEDVEKIVLENEQTKKYLEGKVLKKVIVVPNKIVNIVV